jgi:hypothetical protein
MSQLFGFFEAMSLLLLFCEPIIVDREPIKLCGSLPWTLGYPDLQISGFAGCHLLWNVIIFW